MCRNKACGGRRCPAHCDPLRQALAHATQRATRWERRYNEAVANDDTKAADHAFERFQSAIDDTVHRSTPTPSPPPPEPPPLEPLDARYVSQLSDDGLETLWSARVTDLAGQQLIEDEWQHRESMASQQRADDHNTALEEAMLRGEVGSQLESIVPPSDRQLVRLWHESARLSDLQLRVERALTERGIPTPAPIVISEGPTEQATEPDHEYDQHSHELDRAWETMTAADYIAYEATLISDPAQRTPIDLINSRPSMAAKDRQTRQDYAEYTFERYVEAETACRSHLLNARGKRLKVDPHSLMNGNAKRMDAYASDEFKGFIAKTGGHMSYARFKSIRVNGKDVAAHRIEGFQDAVSV